MNGSTENEYKRHIYYASIFLASILGVGSVAYHLVEEMSLFEGFYMTFITITTIGFGEIRQLSTEGRMVTIVLSLLGIGTIAYIASQLSQLLFESELLRKRRIAKKINGMENHYIICGYGRIGRRIAEVLKQASLPIIVVENNQTRIQLLSDQGMLYIEGNAQHEDVLEKAGIRRAKALISTLSEDQQNVFVTLVARDFRDDLFILVRTNQHQNIKKMLRAGANKVISPYEIGADRMTNVILRPNVDAFMEKMLGGNEEHGFEEMRVEEHSPLVGKRLADSNIRNKYEVVVIAVVSSEDGQMIFNPGGEFTLQAGDTLIVIGSPTNIHHLQTEECMDFRTGEERAEDLKADVDG